jgi:hypothetical protein
LVYKFKADGSCSNLLLDTAGLCLSEMMQRDLLVRSNLLPAATCLTTLAFRLLSLVLSLHL